MSTLLHKILIVAFILAAVTGVALAWPQGAARAAHADTAPAPFLYRPYYGTATVISRSVSLFDHDKPWYENDGTFVRYDGATYTGSAVMNCQPHISCYDGHNGYDINMVFEPVLAAAGGTVIRASWFNPANHLDGGGLWVAIDHGLHGGTDYVSMYCHLSAVLVSIGQTVGTQWQIGTSGSTGSATGPHLHFTVFQMPNWEPMDPFGWWDTTKPDPNPTPDYYLWVNNPVAPTQSPCLGCDAGQPHAGATVVDDASAGFSTTGAWQTAQGEGLIGGGMHWAATSTGNATATATWRPTLPSAGTYEVGVYVDPENASSQWAPYTITSLGADGSPMTTTVHIDQEHIGIFQNAYGTINTGPQWVGLGTYTFGAGANPSGQVTVSNATGEAGAQLGADAMEFVPVSAATPPVTPTPIPATATPVPPTPTPTMPPISIPSRNRNHR